MTKIFSPIELSASNSIIKHSYLKELVQIASQSPDKLYQHFDKIAKLLDSEDKIIKCTGIELLGYLSAVDTENKIDHLIKELIHYLHSGQLIVSNHAISALTLIAKTKSRYKCKIIREFLQLENDKFKTEECKNILIGKILEAFKQLLPEVKYNEHVIDFIIRAKLNKKSSVKNKASELLVEILLVY